MKNIRNFYLKIFIILVGKFSVYLNRHVFVMNAYVMLMPIRGFGAGADAQDDLSFPNILMCSLFPRAFCSIYFYSGIVGQIR